MIQCPCRCLTMRFALIVLIVCGLGFGGTGPKADKCRADQKLWLSKLNPPDPVYDDDPRLPTWDGEDRQYQEMRRCTVADHEYHAAYDRVMEEINADRTIRIGRFLRRHDRLDEFKQANPTLRPDSARAYRAALMIAFLRRQNLWSLFVTEDAEIHKNGLVVK